jgi:hypothetical protein
MPSARQAGYLRFERWREQVKREPTVAYMNEMDHFVNEATICSCPSSACPEPSLLSQGNSTTNSDKRG